MHQDRQQALATVGTTALAAKRLGYYAQLTVLPGPSAVANGAEESSLLEWAPNSRKIFLGRQITQAGEYEVVAEVLDALQRRQGDATVIRFALAEGGTAMACTPGQPHCLPQRLQAQPPIDSVHLLAEQIFLQCKELSPQVGRGRPS